MYFFVSLCLSVCPSVDVDVYMSVMWDWLVWEVGVFCPAGRLRVDQVGKGRQAGQLRDLILY